jgi:predicted Rossmann fold flavoprotein
MYDVAILGAGASGLMAASVLKNKKVALIDSNSKIGEKIKISGGAKCNITNKYLDENYYLGDKSLIKNTFSKFNQFDLLEFVNKNGVYPKINEKIVKGTYFCNSSSDLLSMFSKLTTYAKKYLNTTVADVEYKDDCFYIYTNNQTIQSKKLIIASGGLSYASLGASDIGYKIAQKFGHSIMPTSPALVGFTVQPDQAWFKNLSGLSLEVKVDVGDKKIEGKMLFAHKGCSGPAILSSSLYWKKGHLSIDFLPTKKSYIPKRVRQEIQDKNIDIRDYKFAPAGNFGYTKAEVTRGGVSTKEINENFESKLQDGLYFVGEVLDVTGELGGYNFQWAFSSSYICAKSINTKFAP